MAGDWIQWTKGLARKREVVMMATALKRDPHEVAGRLMDVWEWADENIPEEAIDDEGTAVIKMSPLAGDNIAFIDTIAGLPGFANAMSDAEWLTPRNGSLTFPHYGRHNGETAKTRGRNAKNQAKRRAKAATEMSPPRGDKKVTRGEKSIPPNPQKGESDFNKDRRKRDRFHAINCDRSAQAIKAWIGSHSEKLIPRDHVTVDRIVKAATQYADQEEFFSAVDRIVKGDVS